MKADDVKLHGIYGSKVNPFAVRNNFGYEVVKKNKTTCWVILWDGGTRTDVVYKNVPYRVLSK